MHAGARGPLTLDDPHGREKIHAFDHERIPERVVHARGAAAHGTFTLHTPIPEVTSAGILSKPGATCPVFLRFSTVQGARGSADTVSPRYYSIQPPD
jgi:catalase